MSEIRKKNRNLGIDLLRAVCMYMIVVFHILDHGGVIAGAAESDSKIIFSILWVLRTSVLCAVNCYAIISGYVGYRSKYHYSNVVQLWVKVLFYSLSISLLFYALGWTSEALKPLLIEAVLPVTLHRYWYFSAYVGCCMLSPIINSAIENMSKRQFVISVFAVVLFFSVIPSLLRFKDAVYLGEGFSTWWLVILYYIGAGIGKYGLFDTVSIKKCWFIYLSTVLSVSVFSVLMENKRIHFGTVDNLHWFARYDAPTILLCAISLVCLFKQLRLNDRMKNVVNRVAPLTFSVYLIHENPLFRERFIAGRFTELLELPVFVLIVAILGIAAFIFIVCCLIDLPRYYMFKRVNIKAKMQRLEDKLYSER